MKSPYGTAVIEVGDDLVDRYAAAGWERVAAKAPTKKSAEGKKSSASDEK